MTYTQLNQIIRKHNEENHVTLQYGDKNPLYCVAVFSASNWPDKDYDIKSRSYIFRSDEKWFLPNMGGNSWYASSLDGADKQVRLDWYDWKADNYYVADKNDPEIAKLI